MTSVSRLVPRQKPEPASIVRTSAHITSDLEASAREAQDASAQIAHLNGQTQGILLTGDDAAHERHEAEIGRLRRVLARAEARHEVLTVEGHSVEASEAENTKACQRAEAEAAVAAVLAKVATGYTEPASQIAAFLAEWEQADRLARAAGIPVPDAALRQPVSMREPDREVAHTAYVDERGQATLNPHPYKPDGMIDYSRVRKQRTFTRTEPGKVTMPRRLPPLASLVSLPRYAEHGDHHRGDSVGTQNVRT